MTPSAQATASANSVLRTRKSRRSSATSNRLIDAAMTTAASTGCGIAWTRPGTNRSIATHEGRRDQAGQLGLRPGLEGHRRPRAARAHREAREQAGRQVGRADPGQLLVAVHLVAGAGGEAAGGRRSCRRSATSEIPTAAANSTGMSATGTAGKVGSGKPWGSTPITATPRAARSSTIESTIATTTAIEDARRPRREPLEAQDDGQAEEADPERPRVRHARGSGGTPAPRRRGRWRPSRTRTAWAAGR